MKAGMLFLSSVLLLSAFGGAVPPAPSTGPGGRRDIGRPVRGQCRARCGQEQRQRFSRGAASAPAASSASNTWTTKLNLAYSNLTAALMWLGLGQDAGIYQKNGIELTSSLIAGGANTSARPSAARRWS